MKRIFFAALCIVGFFCGGCVTKGYVRAQVEPLQQRVTQLENARK